jgi:hypothetical protein
MKSGMPRFLRVGPLLTHDKLFLRECTVETSAQLVLTELSFFPSTIFSPILVKGIPYQYSGRFEPARVRVMNHISEYHLIEKYKLLKKFEY